MINPTCPICDAAGSSDFTAGDHTMYRCRGCRTAFVYPVPDAAFLAAFYSRFHESGEGSYDQFEPRMAADFPAKVARVQVAAGSQSIRLLDVGCGKGYFVKACRDAGLDAHGIDLSDTGIAHAKDVLGVPAYCGNIEEAGSQLGVFDVVTFWATIEHLPDPLRTLRSIQQVIKPGGILLADTGIGDDWLDRVLPGRVQWYAPPLHLFVFSAAGLRAAMERSGFAVLAHDKCFERSQARRVIRKCRNIVGALSLRCAAEIAQVRYTGFTRFAIGNLQMITARKQA